MRIVHDLDIGLWKEFVARLPQGNIFHTPEMFEVFTRSRGYRPALWAAVENERVLALFPPVTIETMTGWLGKMTAWAVCFGSLLCASTDDALNALGMLLESYKRDMRRKLLFTELRNLSSLGSARTVLEGHGFAHEEHLNYEIDLERPAEAIFQAMEPRSRKKIQRALNRGDVTVQTIENKDTLTTFYQLLKKTYRSARVPLADWSLFEAAFDILVPEGMARFFLASVHGVPAAASMKLLYKGVIYAWYGGMDRDYRAYRPNELMTWHSLQWGARSGFRTYDFGGAGRPGDKYGVRDFKSKFGGRLVNYGRDVCVHKPLLLRMSKAGYHLCRHSGFGLKRKPQSDA
jgi:hypothetical protein